MAAIAVSLSTANIAPDWRTDCCSSSFEFQRSARAQWQAMRRSRSDLILGRCRCCIMGLCDGDACHPRVLNSYLSKRLRRHIFTRTVDWALSPRCKEQHPCMLLKLSWSVSMSRRPISMWPSRVKPPLSADNDAAGCAALAAAVIGAELVVVEATDGYEMAIGEFDVPEEAVQCLPGDVPISKLLQPKQHQQMVGHRDQPCIGADLMQRRTHGGIRVETKGCGDGLVEVRGLDVGILPAQRTETLIGNSGCMTRMRGGSIQPVVRGQRSDRFRDQLDSADS